MPLPTPHLYEHPDNIASVAIGRQLEGEDGVLFAHFFRPEDQPLTQLEGHLNRFKTAPINSVSTFRQAWRISQLPLPLRRFMWWAGLNLSGGIRARHLGTFGMSVYSGLGADSLHPLSPLTTTLNYGPIRPNGWVDVRLVYDHRVLDGATVAKALGRLEAVLTGQIMTELTGLARQAA
jgi:hypothetical protein